MMKKILGLCGGCGLLLLSLLARAGDTPGSYTSYRFGPAVTSLHSVDFAITVKTDPGYRASVFWSNQFSLVGTHSGAYTGMQSNGGDPRQFLFSVWDATEARGGSKGSRCVNFGGEGVGKSCRMAHDWQQGHTYRFHVAYEGDRWLGVTVTDLTTRQSFKLGSIRTASDGISPFGMVNWTEYFEWNSPDSDCYNQPYASAEFKLPSGDGGQAVASISQTHLSKTCTAYSEVRKDAGGSLQRNAIGNSLRGAIVGDSHRCIAARGGEIPGTPAISAACNGGIAQAWVFAVDHTLRLQDHNLCLGVVGQSVTVDRCGGDPRQHWQQVGAQLRNEGSGACLVSGKAGVPLTAGKCNAVPTQGWQLPLPGKR